METIINFLTGLGEIAVSAYEYLNSIIQNTVYVFQLLTYFALNIPKYFSWIPGEYLVILSLVFQIAVIYKILGKEG